MKISASHFRLIIRLVLAAVFIWASIAKLISGGPAVASSVFESVTSGNLALRYVVIFSELLLGFWLLSGFLQRSSVIAAIIVLSAFSALLTAEIIRPNPKPCGCGLLVSASTSSVRADLTLGLVRNGLLIIGGGWFFLAAERKRGSPLSSPISGPVGAI
jgi:uncharacterized membrane protein YphA (DoxX/SURF4 family)